MTMIMIKTLKYSEYMLDNFTQYHQVNNWNDNDIYDSGVNKDNP